MRQGKAVNLSCLKMAGRGSIHAPQYPSYNIILQTLPDDTFSHSFAFKRTLLARAQSMIMLAIMTWAKTDGKPASNVRSFVPSSMIPGFPCLFAALWKHACTLPYPSWDREANIRHEYIFVYSPLWSILSSITSWPWETRQIRLRLQQLKMHFEEWSKASPYFRLDYIILCTFACMWDLCCSCVMFQPWLWSWMEQFDVWAQDLLKHHLEAQRLCVQTVQHVNNHRPFMHHFNAATKACLVTLEPLARQRSRFRHRRLGLLRAVVIKLCFVTGFRNITPRWVV